MSHFTFIRSVALSATLLVVPALHSSPIPFGADQAFAGNGNGNGNGGGGGGNGNASGNGGGSGNAGGNAGGQSNASQKQATKESSGTKSTETRKSLKDVLLGSPKNKQAAVSPTKTKLEAKRVASSPKGVAKKQNKNVAGTKVAKLEKPNKGAVSSKLGALNAAHASAQAFANASPNSRIGKIRAYYVANAEAAKAALAVLEADAALLKAAEELAGAKLLQAAAFKAKIDYDTLKSEYDVAKAAFDTLPVDDPARPTEEAVAELLGKVEVAETTLKTADEALININLDTLAGNVETAQNEADDAKAAAETSAADALAALEAAANKPITDEVRAALDKLLEGKIVLEDTAEAEPVPQPELL